MRLLVVCALVIGLGIQLLIGLLSIARELFSDSIFGVPTESNEPPSMSSSATPSRRAPRYARR
jgi:hypothetical protein